MYLGGGSLAWCADYAQIYIFDRQYGPIQDIDQLDASIFERGWHVGPAGFIIYTQDALHQRIIIAIHGSAPDASVNELLSEDAWTKSSEFAANFPSKAMIISSPSKTGGEAYAPTFALPAMACNVRVSWLEYSEDCYDAFRPKPDIFQIEIWPASAVT
jgi:hypothetical protein